jgi:hypothetical protein
LPRIKEYLTHDPTEIVSIPTQDSACSIAEPARNPSFENADNRQISGIFDCGLNFYNPRRYFILHRKGAKQAAVLRPHAGRPHFPLQFLEAVGLLFERSRAERA